MSEIKTNKISSLASNNDITLDPDGTGDTIVASGNLGVGTSSPAQLLEISGGAPIIRLTDTGASNNYSEINADYTSGSLQISADTADASSNSRIIFAVDNVERARITDGGDIAVGKTGDSFGTAGFFLNVDPGQLDVTCNGNNPLRLNRLASDGILTSYQQASSEEGTVSVSGTTVSYNGGHLSRWSRLTSGNKDESIVKGTVMTNLDQMVVWTHAATDDEAEWTEDNEQLNCMAVSSVEGDANVAGVFVNWDDRDAFNDMNVAMTGDMVIRIAQDTTVARGDLLMSAGDGTAKPQGDDIVRSKTIAKVTSTTVSHTYDDGTYLVPCVLMAC